MPNDTKVADSSLQPETCVARRHMRPAMFMTYAAMVAACKSKPGYEPGDPLIFWGQEHTLANLNNRNKHQESDAIDALKKAGWIVSLESEQGRFKKGQWTSKQYRVLEHDEYVATHGGCPPLRYDPLTGEKLIPGRLSKSLERTWILKMIGLVIPVTWVDAIAQGMLVFRWILR